MESQSNGALVIRGGTAVLETGLLDNADIILMDGKIAGIGPSGTLSHPVDALIISANGLWVCPGFIDLHVHGAGGDWLGVDVGANRRVARTLASFGTTAFLAGISSASVDKTAEAVEAVRHTTESEAGGAQIIGIHLEGPFLSMDKKGSMNPRWLRLPSLEEIKKLEDISQGLIRLVAIAPELEGALDLISYLKKQGIVASLGHSNATYAEALAGIRAGITQATHTFNAMTGLHHREPGAVGAILTEDTVTAELIADLHHVAPAAVLTLIRCKGPGKVALITDGVFTVGLPDGEYANGDGRRVFVKDGTCRLADGTLAGSISTMNRNIANLVQQLGVGMVDAVAMASLVPARCLGIDHRKGSLAPGKDGDITIMDTDFQVRRVYIQGREVYCP